MFLKSIVINGFKSFALRRELLIHEGITGIVGPNGSGKSNIADAMRWVLGEQSSRNLRGSSMQEVIFKGTQTRPPKGSCEVSLLFDNTDHHFDVPYSEVLVRRRLFRNGDSEYSINGTVCRLKDVIALFRDTGLGRDGYSIIGQGRINRILDSRAGERRQVFDEAAGIMKYRSRRDEAERNLQKTRDNVARADDIIAELQSQIAPLEAQMEAAKEHQELEDALRTAEVNIVLSTAAGLNERIGELEKVRAEREAAQQEAADARGEAARKRLEAKEAVRTLQETVDRLAADRQESAGEAERTGARIMVLEQRGQDLERFLREDEEQVALLRERSADAAASHDALLPELAALRRRRTELRGQISGAAPSEAAEKRLSADRAALRQRLAELQQTIEAGAQSALTDQLGLGRAVSELERLEAEGRSLEARIGQLGKELSANRSRTEMAAEEVRHATEELSDALRRRRELEEEQARQSARLAEVERRLASETARANLLAEMQSGYDGYYDSVRRLFQSLKGHEALRAEVLGTVAESVRVEKRYELALETALGSAMQNVIVTTDAAARDLIALLRRERLGRVTFLPLRALNARMLSGSERETVRTHGLLGAASSLVRCSETVKPAVDYLLGRTVVAETLDQALDVKRSGRNSFRLVTLAGDIVVPGGAITGGSERRSQVSLLGRRRMREELEAARRELIGQRRTIGEQTRGTAAELDSVKRLAAGLEARIQEGRLEEARCRAEGDRLRAELAEAHKRQDDWRGDLRVAHAARDRSDAARAEAEAAFAGLRSERAGLEEELARLEEEIRGARAETEVRRQQAAELEKELAAVNAGLEPKEKAAALAQANAQQIQDELQTLERRQQERQDELARGTQEAQTLNGALADLQKRTDGLDRELEKLRRALKREEENVDFYEQQVDDSDTEERAGSRQLYRVEAGIEKARAQLQLLSDRLWQEYELTWANAEKLRVEPFSVPAAEAQAERIRSRLREIGPVNLQAGQDYERVSARLDGLLRQREDLEAASGDLEVVVAELTAAMRSAFTERFEEINAAFSRSFQELFGGGSARLLLEEGVPVMEAGVEIQAEPPGKKLQNIALLSDGEKALTAIALCMAMLEVNPSPICLLDEIDAPLDDRNVNRLAEYLARFRDHLQFIVITHKKTTMSVCDTLYGVAMHEKGVSDIVSVAME